MSSERLLTVLISPVFTEKAARVADAHNQYTFKVRKDASKHEIKRAVEKVFGVQVEKVRVLNVKGKVKLRPGQPKGKRPDWKKAYVTLAAGQEIDFTSE